jgi:hypothetical protein
LFLLGRILDVPFTMADVDGTAPPLYIYADRTDRTGDASA